jgi:hypothetical protein
MPCKAGTFAAMPNRFRAHLLLGLLALCSAQGWNRWNLAAMEASPVARGQVRDGRAVMVVDDASYLQWVDRLLGARPDLDRGPLADRPGLRTPGYGLLYLLPRLVLAPGPAVSAMVWFQCLLFAAAAMLLWEALIATGISPWVRWSLVLAYALLPTFQGFLFYTISEGITPALSLVVACAALLMEHRRAKHWTIIATLACAWLAFSRPALLWLALPLAAGAWARWRSLPRTAALVLLALLPLTGWWAYTSWLAGHPLGLHPVYRADEPGINRPMHGAFWELAKSWGARGDAFHGAMEPAFRAALECDTALRYADAYVALAPAGMLSAAQEVDIREAFRAWQRFNCTALAPALRSAQGTVAGTTGDERSIMRTLERTTSEWRREYPAHHHLLVPVRVFGDMLGHSNLNLWLFQHTLRGAPWVEALRWVSASLHIALLLIAGVAFAFRMPRALRLASAGCVAYLFYLAYVQRGVEERYTLPVLFVGVTCAAFVVNARNRE